MLEQPKRAVKGVNAAPDQTQQEVNDNNCFTSLVSMICGSLLKEINDTIPPPTESTPLKTTLNELNLTGFSKDICRSMVSMLDLDRSGKLGYIEFKQLWEIIRQWKNVWLLYDKDKSGTFSGFEFRDALTSAGYKLNSKVLNILMHRYGNSSGQLDFDDFMMCSVKLKTMIDIFKSKDPEGKNTASFSLEEWLDNTLYS